MLFSEWTTMLDLIGPIVTGHGQEFVRIDGKVPQKRRQQLVARFQKDPSCRMFMTTNAGSVGLNLQAADTVINVDLPWNPAVLEQRIGRAHRMGQKRPVQVFILVTEETIEERMLKTLAAKAELSTAAIDFGSDIDEVDLESGMEALKQRLEVLLGREPEAPRDETEREFAEAQVEVRKKRVGLAGGRLLGAAFEFLGEMLPPVPVGQPGAAAKIRDSLLQCSTPDADGRPCLTVTLPDNAAGAADAREHCRRGRPRSCQCGARGALRECGHVFLEGELGGVGGRSPRRRARCADRRVVRRPGRPWQGPRTWADG